MFWIDSKPYRWSEIARDYPNSKHPYRWPLTSLQWRLLLTDEQFEYLLRAGVRFRDR